MIDWFIISVDSRSGQPSLIYPCLPQSWYTGYFFKGMTSTWMAAETRQHLVARGSSTCNIWASAFLPEGPAWAFLRPPWKHLFPLQFFILKMSNMQTSWINSKVITHIPRFSSCQQFATLNFPLPSCSCIFPETLISYRWYLLPEYFSIHILITRTFSYIIKIKWPYSGNLAFMQCYCLTYYSYSVSSNCPNHILYEKVKVAQLCPTLCDPMNCTVHGIL